MTIALLMACGATCVAAVPEDHRAPVPVLAPGKAVDLPDAWNGVDDHGKATPVRPGPTVPWVELVRRGTRHARIETRPGVPVKAWHTYRLTVPVRAGPGVRVQAGLRVSSSADRSTRRFVTWPRWHVGGAIAPRDTRVTGYVIVPPGWGAQAVAYVTGPIASKGHHSVEVGTPRLFDLGPVPARARATLLVDGFEHWTDAGMPWGHHVVFAKPGQFIPVSNGVHTGRTAACNHRGRALLFGPMVSCRFGTVVRMRVWARGTGRVTLSAIPYLGGLGRGVACCSAVFPVSDDWRPYEIVFGQHTPEADTLRPTLFLHGPVTIDSLCVERLAPPQTP